MVLTQEGHYRLSDEILRHISLSNAFVDFVSQTTIRLALLGALFLTTLRSVTSLINLLTSMCCPREGLQSNPRTLS